MFVAVTSAFQMLLVLVFSVLLDSSRSQTAWGVDDIPNPMKNPELCGRFGLESSMICDPSNILDPSTKDSIDRRAARMWDVEFAAVIIPSMVRKSWLSSAQSEAEYYASTLLNKWGVGDSSQKNGVLIFLAVDDRVIYIALGTRIQDQLSSVEVDRVVSHVYPLLKLGEYGSAIERAIIEINLIATKEIVSHISVQKEKDNRLYMARVLGPWLLFVLLSIMTIWVMYSRKEEAKLKKSRDDLRALLIELCLPYSHCQNSSTLFFSASCPICFQLYLPTAVRRFDSALNTILLASDESSANIGEIVEDPSAENTDILPESYERVLIKFIESTSKLRNVAQEDACHEKSYSNIEEHDPLLGSQNSQRRVNSDLDRDDFRNPHRFGCGHIFCLSCLRSFSNETIVNTCPLCKLEQYQAISTTISSPNLREHNPKTIDLVYRLRKLHASHSTALTSEMLSSLESVIAATNREESLKLVFELCCELNCKLLDLEMRKRHIDDGWKNPGRTLAKRKSD